MSVRGPSGGFRCVGTGVVLVCGCRMIFIMMITNRTFVSLRRRLLEAAAAPAMHKKVPGGARR